MRSRIFVITLAVANLSLILYGVSAIVEPGILLEPFSAHVYQFPAEATGATNYLAALYRLIGYFNIVPGVFGLILLSRYWATRQAWYARLVVASTALTYVGPVVFDNTAGTIGFFEILEHVLFALVLIVGFSTLRRQAEVA